MANVTPTAAQYHEFDIPPGGVFTAYGEGDSFLVVQTNVPLEIMREGAPFLPYDQGDREDLPPGQSFKRLEVKNPSLVTASVRLYSGFGRRLMTRVAVIEPQTRVRPYTGANATTLPANGGFITLSGLCQAGELRRKAAIVSNDDPNLPLKICDANGNPFATVAAGFSGIYPISEAIRVVNNNATPVAYSAGEIFWIF